MSYRIAGGLVAWIRDRNGNVATFDYDGNSRLTKVTDPLGREVTIAYDVAEGGNYGTCDRITYKGFGGADHVIRVSKTSLGNALRAGYSLTTPAYLFPGLQGSNYSNFNPTDVVSSVWLPDTDGVSRRDRLYYNSFGELSRVELPTGGAFEYDYAPGTTNGYGNGVVFINNDNPQIYRRAVQRRVYADGVNLTSRMTYSRPETEDALCCGVTTLGYVVAEERDGTGTQGTLLTSSKHYFHGLGAAPSFHQPATVLTHWRTARSTRPKFMTWSEE